MITLYSYPELFGVADNNGYGLKVFAFLRLNGMPFKHEHVFDAAAAPSPISSSTISTPRSSNSSCRLEIWCATVTPFTAW